MQYDQAVTLQEKWGDEPCDHRTIEEEFYRENETGSLVCIQCGVYVPESRRSEIIERKLGAKRLIAFATPKTHK